MQVVDVKDVVAPEGAKIPAEDYVQRICVKADSKVAVLHCDTEKKSMGSCYI